MNMLNTEVNTSENKIESNLTQQKADANLIQNQEQNIQKIEEKKDPESQEDPNWKAFREARKKDRAEKEAAEKKAKEKEAEIAALKAAMEVAFSKSAPTTQAYQQYYGINQGYEQPEETEEQRIERKVNEMLSKKEQEYLKQQADIEAKEWPNRLKSHIPDVWQVCSQENLDYLDYHYPEISRPLQRLEHGYDKWYDTYHAIKKLIPNHSTAKKEAIRAEINNNKPKSISSTGITQTGDKARETWQDAEARRAENWARMQRVMKGV